MPSLPLLIFPTPDTSNRVKIKRNIQQTINFPAFDRQNERLTL